MFMLGGGCGVDKGMILSGGSMSPSTLRVEASKIGSSSEIFLRSFSGRLGDSSGEMAGISGY